MKYYKFNLEIIEVCSKTKKRPSGEMLLYAAYNTRASVLNLVEVFEYIKNMLVSRSEPIVPKLIPPTNQSSKEQS